MVLTYTLTYNKQLILGQFPLVRSDYILSPNKPYHSSAEEDWGHGFTEQDQSVLLKSTPLQINFKTHFFPQFGPCYALMWTAYRENAGENGNLYKH